MWFEEREGGREREGLKGGIEMNANLVIMVGTEEDGNEGEPDDTG